MFYVFPGSTSVASRRSQVLKQGVAAPDTPMAGPEKLPAAMQKGPTLHSATLAASYHFFLLPNTAGQATLNQKPQPRAISQAPPPPHYITPAPVPFFLAPVKLPQHQTSQVPLLRQVALAAHCLLKYCTISSARSEHSEH